jgi:CheY-like chemotaxis protein
MLKILLVDDDDEEAEVFTAALKTVNENVELIHADDCVDLTESIRRHNPDIVFMDINMPLINGIECLKSIRSSPELKSLPIVMYSTSNNQKNILESFNNNANLYIIKPDSYRGIIIALEKVLKLDWSARQRPAFSEFVLA